MNTVGNPHFSGFWPGKKSNNARNLSAPSNDRIYRQLLIPVGKNEYDELNVDPDTLRSLEQRIADKAQVFIWNTSYAPASNPAFLQPKGVSASFLEMTPLPTDMMHVTIFGHPDRVSSAVGALEQGLKDFSGRPEHGLPPYYETPGLSLLG